MAVSLRLCPPLMRETVIMVPAGRLPPIRGRLLKIKSQILAQGLGRQFQNQLRSANQKLNGQALKPALRAGRTSLAQNNLSRLRPGLPPTVERHLQCHSLQPRSLGWPDQTSAHLLVRAECPAHGRFLQNRLNRRHRPGTVRASRLRLQLLRGARLLKELLRPPAAMEIMVIKSISPHRDNCLRPPGLLHRRHLKRWLHGTNRLQQHLRRQPGRLQQMQCRFRKFLPHPIK